MKNNIVLLAVFALGLALAPTAQAELNIYVHEDTVNGEVHFLWNGIIGNDGTNTDLSTEVWSEANKYEPDGVTIRDGYVEGELRYAPGSWGGSADFMRALNGPGSNFTAADRSRADVDNTGVGDWDGPSHYQGGQHQHGGPGSPASGPWPYGTGTGDDKYTDHVVTSNIPFALGANGGLSIGYLNDNGTGVPDLNTDVFTGSFSLPGTFTTGTFSTLGMFDTPTTSLTSNTTVPLWRARNFDIDLDELGAGGGSIVFDGDLLAGDTDLDKDVDNADVGAIIGSFTGSTGTGKTWFDGDSDFDGDVDNSDVGAAIGAFTGALAGNLTDTGTIANLIYNPVTGNLTMDASEAQTLGTITSFQLESLAGFTDANYNSATGGTFGGGFEDASDSVLGDSDFTFVGFSGLHNMGNVAPTGLTLLQLESFLTKAVYTGSSGSGQQVFDLQLATAIPEPTSLTLLGLGGGLMMLRRRRRQG